jgi:hypothetical protein
MFAVSTPRANNRRSKNADKSTAALSAKQACSGVLDLKPPCFSRISDPDAASACFRIVDVTPCFTNNSVWLVRVVCNLDQTTHLETA